jgi:alkylation response protein AidB-like acyl-CoA dehydrogenase
MTLAELTDEQREIRDLARRFADEVIAPRAAQWDRDHEFPKDVFAQLGELGLMGVCVPAELGGAGADFLAYVLVLEELSRGDAGVGVTVAVHTSACTLPLIANGSDAQVQQLVPPLAQGHEIGAFALTEPGSGSDAGAMLTRADDEGRISGTKQWITNGSHAHTFLVFAKDPDKPSAFVVRRGAEGFSVTREEEKMGLNSSSTADLAFESTPGERLGGQGGGMRIALSTLDGGRTSGRDGRADLQPATERLEAHDVPALLLGDPGQLLVGVDHHRVADRAQHREVRRAVAVGPRRRQVQPVALGDLAHADRLAVAVAERSLELPRVEHVALLVI